MTSMTTKHALYVIFFQCCLMGYSQTESPAGTYYLQMGSEDSRFIEYKLSLQPDGTFDFHSHTKSSEKIGLPEEVIQYGHGAWAYKDKKVFFSTNRKEDLNQEFTLDLGNSKAHFISKSPRALSDLPFKTRLKFFSSDIFWIEGIEMIKQ